MRTWHIQSKRKCRDVLQLRSRHVSGDRSADCVQTMLIRVLLHRRLGGAVALPWWDAQERVAQSANDERG
jgi:hypothetical protein